MKKLLSDDKRIVFEFLLLAVVFALAAFIFLPLEQEGLILFSLAIFISIVGLLGGPVRALSMTLVFYFFIGSVLFWTYLTNSLLINLTVSFSHLFIWTIVVLFAALISGRLYTLLKRMQVEKEKLQEQIRTLVAVDPITGFDNEERLSVELELEFSRSRRYEIPFTLLLLRINHIEQFKKLYGQNEYERLLQHFAKNIFRIIRVSDLKFRISDDTFALLLTNTNVEDIHIVIKKLEETLTVYQLENKKYINLSIIFGYSSHPSEHEDSLAILEEAKEQVSFDVT